MFKKIWSSFTSVKGLIIINSVLTILGLFQNITTQAYCVPSLWAAIVIGISLLLVIVSPLKAIKNTKSPIIGFFAGVSVFSFLYCILFLEDLNIIAIPFILFGIGIIMLIPHFFAFQLIRYFLFKNPHKKVKLFFALGFCTCVLVSIASGVYYSKAINRINEFVESDYELLEKNYMTEKILGMHFIYHTRICVYDGWRPPKHEPIMILGGNGRRDPLIVPLEKRLELYKKFFPENKYKFDCSCGIAYSSAYHKDELWE
ncbi:hypothetical protein N8289_00915 [Flavobacteriales bacterium]|nr:hypothetical protein [Flavobacteriales bacterium]MDC1370378.1 hypothetical protein [Flavobacteriales bacterium]